jgi:hypothetical protein
MPSVARTLRALFRSKKWLGARGLKTSATAADRRDFIRAISFAYTSKRNLKLWGPFHSLADVLLA